MNGISAFVRETPGRSLAPSATCGCSEKRAVFKQGSGLSLDATSAGPFILDFLASRTMRIIINFCWS